MSVAKVYQLKDECKDRMFLDFNSVRRGWGPVDLDWYDCVYELEIDDIDAEDREEAMEALENLFGMFNLYRPADFYGHSLSVSDIIDIDGNCFYCDNIGWEVM